MDGRSTAGTFASASDFKQMARQLRKLAGNVSTSEEKRTCPERRNNKRSAR